MTEIYDQDQESIASEPWENDVRMTSSKTSFSRPAAALDALKTEPVEVKPKRTKRQQNEDAILAEAENLIRDGRDMVLEGIDIFSSLEPPQHKNLETILGQALEQVIEYRRLHP